MEKFESVLELPVNNLRERRTILERELSKTVYAWLKEAVKEDLQNVLKEFGLYGTYTFSWDFGYESDDEGGTDLHIHYVNVRDENGKTLDTEEYSVKKRDYDYSLQEELYDQLYEYTDDLGEHGIEEMTVTVEKGE